MNEKVITATEVSFRLNEFENHPAMIQLREHLDGLINRVVERIMTTPIQFRFPKSKKKRIRKKWAKNPENLRPLLDQSFGNFEIEAGSSVQPLYQAGRQSR
jgi:hypothetical protein